MNAMEKAAWTEATVALAALATVAASAPWLGARAVGGFGLLGLVAASGLFLRPKRGRVVVDERDREIERRSTAAGVATAWTALFLSLIVLTLWADRSRAGMVSIGVLNWLIWIQFAIYNGVKGGFAVALYRGGSRAA